MKTIGARSCVNVTGAECPKAAEQIATQVSWPIRLSLEVAQCPAARKTHCPTDAGDPYSGVAVAVTELPELGLRILVIDLNSRYECLVNLVLSSLAGRITLPSVETANAMCFIPTPTGVFTSRYSRNTRPSTRYRCWDFA